MLENGIWTRDLLRRLATYKRLVSSPSEQHEEFAEQYAERVREALAMSAGNSRYVPGTEVDGSKLRSYSAFPIITGPLVCQLCESDFLTEEDFPCTGLFVPGFSIGGPNGCRNGDESARKKV